MDPMKDLMDEIVADKTRRRKARAALPFPEKIRILVHMQERRAPILRARGLKATVWRIGES